MGHYTSSSDGPSGRIRQWSYACGSLEGRGVSERDMLMAPTALGVTGPLGAGRTTVAAYLEKHGFQRVALSDIIREVAAAEGIQEPTVAQMQDLGDRMRQNDGPAVLASQALSRWDRTRSIVLDGIKNWGEADYLRRNEAGFHLVAVDASEETREKRKVGVVSGMLTSADFAAAEQRDRAETDAWGVLIEEGQQVGNACGMQTSSSGMTICCCAEQASIWARTDPWRRSRAKWIGF